MKINKNNKNKKAALIKRKKSLPVAIKINLKIILILNKMNMFINVVHWLCFQLLFLIIKQPKQVTLQKILFMFRSMV